jgi:hypothetical protein
MIVDFVSGWNMEVNDGSTYWRIADAVESHGAKVRRHDWKTDLRPLLLNAAVVGKRMVVVYSYGCEDLFKAIDELAAQGIQVSIDFLVIVVGVNRVADGQIWEKCWQIPDGIGRVLCFNTVYRGSVAGRLPVIPECCPIRNPDMQRVNADLFFEGVDHVNVMELEEVQTGIIYAAGQLLAEEARA